MLVFDVFIINPHYIFLVTAAYIFSSSDILFGLPAKVEMQQAGKRFHYTLQTIYQCDSIPPLNL
jgi:hypothetical protein